jgi:hypothetical protein
LISDKQADTKFIEERKILSSKPHPQPSTTMNALLVNLLIPLMIGWIINDLKETWPDTNELTPTGINPSHAFKLSSKSRTLYGCGKSSNVAAQS